jgi:hypothetical protein
MVWIVKLKYKYKGTDSVSNRRKSYDEKIRKAFDAE